MYHQAPPPPHAPPAPGRGRLTRRQLTISAAAVAAVPILLVAGVALSPSKLERAGKAISGECSTPVIERAEVRFVADYANTGCLLAIRAQLVELGFDRGDLETAAERPVTAGGYRLVLTERPGMSPVGTITAD